jgi:hypothetical protein
MPKKTIATLPETDVAVIVKLPFRPDFHKRFYLDIGRHVKNLSLIMNGPAADCRAIHGWGSSKMITAQLAGTFSLSAV